MKQAGSNRMIQLNELDELRNEAYENTKIYKVPVRYKHIQNAHTPTCFNLL